MAGSEILEGFLCPICVQDLGSLSLLQDHFDVFHAGEDRALINQIKGLFGKAKRVLLGQELESSEGFSINPVIESTPPGLPSLSSAHEGLDPAWWEPQEIGMTRSLTDSFKTARSLRIDRFVIETNKLLIRLDKLVNSDVPMDAVRRKAFEKTVVAWAQDADANLCMTCGKQFTLTRRRHHCRLCGRILCNRCSHFLPYDLAKKLTNPSFLYEGEGFHRSSSNSSLNSIFSPEGEVFIRTCNECRFLLERRDEQMTQRSIKPVIVQLYDRIRSYMQEAEQILPSYIQAANSLNAGDTSSDLVSAQALREKLVKTYENIRTLNKRIAVLGLDNPQPPTPKSLRLQQMISAHASAFLQENLLSLPPLPTEEELVKIREINRLETQRRVAEEKRKAVEREREQKRREELKLTEEQQKLTTFGGRHNTRESSGYPPQTSIRYNRNAEDGVRLPGWKPTEVFSDRLSNEDPMIQQMNIIRGYIKQAKDAQKWDEVQMLQENLEELQREFWESKESDKPSK